MVLETIIAGFYVSVVALFSGLALFFLQVIISMIGGAINDMLFGMNTNDYSIWHTITGNIAIVVLLVIWYFLGLLVI